MRQFTIIGAPASSLRHGAGVVRAPEALRDLGLCAVLGADDAGDMDCDLGPLQNRGPSGLLAENAVIEASAVMRRRIAHMIETGYTPFVLGGCCSIMPGCLAGACDATRQHGGMGLVYVDGHSDLYDGDTSPDGEAADMPLATVLGRGPKTWMNALGPAPLLQPENVALMGFRDRDEAAIEGALSPEDFGPGMAICDADSLRGSNAEKSALNVAAKLAVFPGRFWLHIDVDVLDDALFPATDYPMPDGLDWHDITSLLRPLLRSDALIGLSLGCYNPERDAGASCGLRLVDLFSAICKPEGTSP
ncbi:MAG: arginase family protein [Hyphomicrobiales bacterium]